MAIGATIAAAAAAAAIPYIIEGGKKLWSLDWGGDPNIAKDSVDFTKQREEENRLMGLQEKGIQDQIDRAKGSTGMAIGRSLSDQWGSGLAGLSGVNMAQAQQGELLASKQIGDLNMDLTNLQVARHNDLMEAAQRNIDGVMRDHEYSTQRYQALDALANARGASEAEKSLYATHRDRFA